MKKLILLVTFALVCQLVEGANSPTVENVTCHNSLKVDIVITNVDAGWNTSVVRQLNKSASCEPKVQGNGSVNYDGLPLPDCAWSSKQLNSSIKYTLKISVTKSKTRRFTSEYDQMYDVSCEYVNRQNKTVASFVPVKYLDKTTETGNGFFRFTLTAFNNDNFTGKVPDRVGLSKTLYFKAMVETQSDAPNLDLFPVHCWSSQSDKPNSDEGKITLIKDGCGDKNVSKDMYDLLSYTCKNDSVKETFAIRTFRYTGAEEGDAVYFHCDLKVCLADVDNSACQCPTDAECDPKARIRRSLADEVDESKVYHASTGPFIFKYDEEEEKKEEEGGEPQSFPTNIAVTVMVSGVAALAIICATAYLVVRSCNKRRQHGDVNVAT